MSMNILVGHAADRQRWGLGPDRVVLLRAVSAKGAVDRMADLRLNQPSQDVEMAFAEPGSYVVAFQSRPAMSDLPALRFNTYLKDEGLTPAMALREQTGKSQSPGRETYSRRAKALVQVGPIDIKAQSHVTKAVGLSLEILPEKSPYALAPGEDLPVRILFEGKPLAGALVKLTNLDFDARPIATHISDADGRTRFTVPRSGSWLLNVIWTKPITGNPDADFETTFSSLTFGYPRTGAGA
ncbi:hypothetical protein BH11PSE2_BH11PSE2_08840 [soil metagenome]